MDISSLSFNKKSTSAVNGPRVAQDMGGAAFLDHLRVAQENASKSPVDNTSQQTSMAGISQTMQESQTTFKTNEPQALVTKEPEMFFPPGFPEDMKQQLTDFLNSSNLSSQEKDAMWATTVTSLHLMNCGPAGFRERLTDDFRFGSPSFDPLKLIAHFGKTLAANGHPNIGKAVQDFLQNAGRSDAARFA